jgi:hypothetical protein
MPIHSFPDICRSGGKMLLDVLDYAVFVGRWEPLFVYLVGEFRLQPTTPRALALYSVFCANDSPARLPVPHLLAPRDFRLERAVEPLRNPRMVCVDAEADPPRFQPAPIQPGKHLFDMLSDAILQQPNGPIAQVERGFDPSLGSHGSLPGGELTPAQRHVVERVWKPWARPQLVAAGFWRVATVGEP